MVCRKLFAVKKVKCLSTGRMVSLSSAQVQRIRRSKLWCQYVASFL